MQATTETTAGKQDEVDSEEEDDDYVPVDDDEDAAEDDAYEALTGGEDPDDPGASLCSRCFRARAVVGPTPTLACTACKRVPAAFFCV